MKKFKKIFAALAASALVAAMSFTSMAATTVTVNRNEQSGTVNTTYTYYQVLKASVSKDKKNVAYFVEDKELKDAIEGLTVKVNNADGASEDKALFKVSPTPAGTKWNVVPTDYLTSLIKNNEANAAKDIAAAFQTIKGKVPEKNKGVFEGETPTAVLNDGYYLVESSLGTALVLETAGAKDGTLEITEKNEYPSDTKVVKAPSVMTDDSATYYVTVVVPTTVDPEKKIIVHDKLDAGLSFDENFDENVKVYVAERTEAADPRALNDDAFTTLDTAKIEVKTGNAIDNSCSFHIDIAPSTYVGKKLIFKYTAKLSDAAKTKKKYNNIEYITYNDKEGKAVYTSQEKTVPVVTYGFDLNKVFKNSLDTEKDLRATFNLYTDTEYAKGANRSPLTFKESEGYTVSKAATATPDIIATKGNVINVRGLSAGTYHLVETSTADGYNLLDHDIIINVTDRIENNALDPEGYMLITNEGSPKETHTVEIENVKGIKLPSTGGMGTTVFAIVGLLVMAGAAVTLIVKKRA